MCHGKASFGSFKLAAKVAKRSNRLECGRQLEPYHCPKCAKWHVGATRRRHLRAPKQREEFAE